MPAASLPGEPDKDSGSATIDQAEVILAAGRRLVAEKGHGFTTQDIIKEAGVALQTFYRYFGEKDRLLLALLAEMIQAHCDGLAEAADRDIDPRQRLEFFIRTTLAPLETVQSAAGGQFITAEHWRLHQLHPRELAEATKPFADLIRRELEAGVAKGVMAPRDPERDAWLTTKIVMSAYHHYSFDVEDPTRATVSDDVCAFCLSAVGAQD